MGTFSETHCIITAKPKRTNHKQRHHALSPSDGDGKRGDRIGREETG